MATEATQAEILQEAAAAYEIGRLATTYMRGLDRGEPDLVRSVFHDDATTDYGAYRGGPDGFVAFASAFLARLTSTHHMIGQTHVVVDGDRAHGEIYFQAHHRVPAEGEARDLFVGGRYVDVYERRGGVWKIAHRTEVVDWVRETAEADTWARRGSAVARGGRGPDDPSQAIWAASPRPQAAGPAGPAGPGGASPRDPH